MNGDEFQMKVYRIMVNERLTVSEKLIMIALNLYQGNPPEAIKIINQVKQEEEEAFQAYEQKLKRGRPLEIDVAL